MTTNPSLSSLPPELLPLIAFQLSHLTPYGPPPLLPLLLTCKSFYVSLSPAHNPHFWATLFSQRFDFEAVKRRFDKLEANEVESEMRERCLMLRRVKERVNLGELVLMPFNEWFCEGKDVPVVEGPWTRIVKEIKSNNRKERIQRAMETGEELEEEELEEEPFLEEEDLLDRLDSHQKNLYSLGRQEYKQDLWRIYLMLLEHDSLNLSHLSLLLPFLSLTFRKDLLLDALRPGYPSETTERSLAVWCGWLAGEAGKRVEMESQSESEERFFVLKPYVFAAHKFDACFAPWTLRILPTALPSPSSIAHPSRSLLSPTTPTSSLPSRPSPQTLVYFNRKLTLTSPIISHGACYAFFERIERDPKLVELAGVAGMPAGAGAGGTGNVNANANARNGHNSPPTIARHQLPNNVVHGPTTLSGPPSLPPIPTFRSLSPLLSPLFSSPPSAPSISSQHDLDFSRLLACSSIQSPGLPDLTFKGKWEGIWEGRFSFFDFDSYRDMLSGQIRRLYEGPFGVQPQVWRLEERVVKVRKPRETEGDEGSEEEEGDDIGILGGRGHILNGGYETSGIASFGGASTPHHHHYNRNRNQNNHNQNSVGRGASFLPGGGNSRRREGGIEGEPSRKRMRSVKDFKNLGNGKSEGEEKKFKDKESEEERYEILLSGTGHSAWGQFILRGRIRSWDGMLILTKEYTPDGRGRWLYRGYLNSDSSIVGRWRDTFTPEELYGYEGTFLMTRRG